MISQGMNRRTTSLLLLVVSQMALWDFQCTVSEFISDVNVWQAGVLLIHTLVLHSNLLYRQASGTHVVSNFSYCWKGKQIGKEVFLGLILDNKSTFPC